jgi:hypothetical protein
MQVGTYPTRNFAQIVTAVATANMDQEELKIQLSHSGLDVSASLCMSPCSSDYIIIRTNADAWRIVSGDPDKSCRFPADNLHREDFDCASLGTHEYFRILRCSSIQPGATSPVARREGRKFYLRTVIVTAAVYRGFGCKLHLAANLLP